MNPTLNQNTAAADERDKMDPGLAPKQNPTTVDRRAALSNDAGKSTVDAPQNTAKNRNVKTADSRKNERVERIIVGIILFVIAVVPLLTFLFSFGNVGDLGVSLHIDKRIAYLTGPAVDLTATGMIVAATWLSYRGMSERELWRIHTLSIICALIMFALNCGPAIYQRHFELAGFSAVGPFLLMAMGFVGPWLLQQITDARPAPAAAAGTPRRERAATEPKAATATAPDAAATQAALATAANPLPLPPAPAPATASTPAVTTTGTGNAPAPTDGNGRRSPADWAKLALPLWEQYTAKHGEAPTAPVLANLLRNAHPDLPVPGSPRSERNIRAAVEDLLDVDDSDDQAASAGTSNRTEAVS